MKKNQKVFMWITSLVLGGLWAYSFSTRIGLLFIVPLWLKIIVMVGLLINFSLLASYLINRFLEWLRLQSGLKMIYPIAAALLTGLVFLLAPYRSVPFRTTHSMTVTAMESKVELVAVYSPDDNIVPRDEFLVGEGISIFDESGFGFEPGSTLTYQRGQTGGLTLSFTQDSGIVSITWDGTQKTIDPGSLQETEILKLEGWRFQADPDSSRILISLPGHTWGDPDLFWTVLGVLLPIADFITLSSILLLIFWLGFRIIKDKTHQGINWKWLRPWIDLLMILTTAMVLIEVGFPLFIPGWLLLFFIPAVSYLAFSQTLILSTLGYLNILGVQKFPKYFSKIDTFLRNLNQSQWTFWILISIVALVGAGAQLSLTSGGMIISGDSVHYLEGARNLAAGNGYIRHIAEGDPVVMTGFPPVYSAILVVGIWLGMGAEVFARYLNTLLLILTVLIAGWMIFKATSKALPAVLSMAFLVMSIPILEIYASAMTEPLFLVLTQVIILLWYNYLQKPSLWKALFIGVLTGIMINTRLAGISLVPVLFLGILIYQQQKIMLRIRDAVVAAIAALIQPAAFFIRNSLVAGRLSESRGLTVASFSREYWEIIGAEISTWFKWKAFFNLPHQRMNAMLISLGVILLFIILWLISKKASTDAQRTDSIIIILLLFIPVYLLVIILNTILFTPEQTSFGLSRYMLPLLLILLILLGKVLSSFWKQPMLFQKVMILFVVLVGISLYYQDAVDYLEDPPTLFRHYTDRKAECGSEVEAIVQAHPEVSFYTNSCEYFYYLTGVWCRHLPLYRQAYIMGGEVYQAVENGDIIAYNPEFGTTPTGIQQLINNLDLLKSACYLEFFWLPETN